MFSALRRRRRVTPVAPRAVRRIVACCAAFASCRASCRAGVRTPCGVPSGARKPAQCSGGQLTREGRWAPRGGLRSYTLSIFLECSGSKSPTLMHKLAKLLVYTITPGGLGGTMLRRCDDARKSRVRSTEPYHATLMSHGLITAESLSVLPGTL
jgi:hypothetical protein